MLDQIQKEIEVWTEYNFGNRGVGEQWQQLLGLIEECGELAGVVSEEGYIDENGNMLKLQNAVGKLSHCFLKRSQGIRKKDYDAGIKDAVGDIMVYLLNFCNKEGISVETCLEETWNEVKKRDWIKFPKNGRTE